MMNRRQFLVRATIGGATVPLLFTEIGCGDDDDDDPGPQAGGETITSQVADGHTHQITIPNADVSAGGARDYTSTSFSGHQHRVEIEDAEMDALAAGCVLTKESVGGPGTHEHVWRIVCTSFVASLAVTSSTADGHQHGLTVPTTNLVADPPVQQILTTAPVNGHTHTLTLDPGDWTVLQECANVTKATSINEAHSHTFIITRA